MRHPIMTGPQHAVESARGGLKLIAALGRDDPLDQSVDGRLGYFLDRTQKAIRRAQLTEAQVRECAAILDEALERIRQVLKESPDTEERGR